MSIVETFNISIGSTNFVKIFFLFINQMPIFFCTSQWNLELIFSICEYFIEIWRFML